MPSWPVVVRRSSARKEDPFEALFRARRRSPTSGSRPRSRASSRRRCRAGAAAFGRLFRLREPYFEDRAAAPARASRRRAPIRAEPYAERAAARSGISSRPASPEGQTERRLGREQQDWQGAYDGVAAPAAPPSAARSCSAWAPFSRSDSSAIGGTLALRGEAANHEVVTIQADSDPAKVKPDQTRQLPTTPAGQNLFDRKNGAQCLESRRQRRTARRSRRHREKRPRRRFGVRRRTPRRRPRPRARRRRSGRPPVGSDFPRAEEGEDRLGARRRQRDRWRRLASGGLPHACRAWRPAPRRRTPRRSARRAAAKSPERAGSTNEAALEAAAAKPEAAKPAAKPSRSAASRRSRKPQRSRRARRRLRRAARGNAERSRGARRGDVAVGAKYSSRAAGTSPDFVQAKVGDKTIYRVRVGHLTEDAAKSMCSAIKGAGRQLLRARKTDRARMTFRAFIAGCAGLRTQPRRRRFLQGGAAVGADPVSSAISIVRDQVRALTGRFRDLLGADAAVLVDQEGGRVQRLTAPHWPVYPPAAAFGRGPRAAIERTRPRSARG